ncbi:hypothetical protein CRUP_003485 [Coryphaenoides rupestris]|nr:hypothetical protein CRUP_003485 [Coryphaenoides rupestris]
MWGEKLALAQEELADKRTHQTGLGEPDPRPGAEPGLSGAELRCMKPAAPAAGPDPLQELCRDNSVSLRQELGKEGESGRRSCEGPGLRWKAPASRRAQQQQKQLIQNYLHKRGRNCRAAKQELQNQLLALQTQLEQLQEETFRLEAAKDDYGIRCEELVQELVEAHSQNKELNSLADEAQSLKDEEEVQVSRDKMLQTNRKEVKVSRKEVQRTNREEVQRTNREEVQQTNREEVQQTNREEVPPDERRGGADEPEGGAV